MDLNSIMKLMTSSDALGQVSSLTGVSEKEAGSALEEIVPMLLKGMQGQANDKSTADSFLSALSAHGQNDTSDIASFLSNVDIEDGSKIVGHLLGDKKEAKAEEVRGNLGLDTKTIMKIMAIAAPLLMSQMGKKAKDDAKPSGQGIAGIVGGLLDGVDANDVLNIVGTLFKK